MDKCSGNHAAALSYAAKLRKIPAYIVVPKNAPKCKVNNVIRYGGQVVLSEQTIASREAAAAKVIQQTGALFIPSSNDGRIIRYYFRISQPDPDKYMHVSGQASYI